MMPESNPVLDAIFNRRSVRDYLEKPVPGELIKKIIEAGVWAPSGLNNQPWRFAVVQDKNTKSQIAQPTRYRAIAEKVRSILDLPENLELMAVVALGYPKHTKQKSSRKALEEFIVKEI